MTEEHEKQVEPDELAEQEGQLLPDREAMSLINPAPGDMPVDPPLTPGPIGPLDDIQ
jgi:hypothetical protein